jgi:PAS domain-containing protein
VTAATADQASPGEASFQFLAEHLPDLDGYDPADRLWSLHFVPLGGGAAGGGMVPCRDVTEQRRAEELLRASQRQLAEAQRIAQVGSWDRLRLGASGSPEVDELLWQVTRTCRPR